MSEDPALRPDALPPWEDADQLRDEGVAFGLAGSRGGLDAKRASIQRHFDARRRAAARERQTLQARLDELVARRVDTKADLDRLDDATASREPPDAPALGRALLGLLLAFGLCGLNYPLLVELLVPAFNAAPSIAAGVLTTGLFGSALLRRDTVIRSWTDALLVGSLPLATALFVVAWRLPDLSTLSATVTLVYLVLFFTFGGLAVLRMVRRVETAVGTWTGRRRALRERERQRDRIRELRDDQLPAIDREAHDLQQALLDIPTREELDAQEASVLALFNSEVALARSTADRLDLSTAEVQAVLHASHAETPKTP